MKEYEDLKQILKEVSTINDELKKYWNTESALMYTSSLDDTITYIEKILSTYEDNLLDFKFE